MRFADSNPQAQPVTPERLHWTTVMSGLPTLVSAIRGRQTRRVQRMTDDPAYLGPSIALCTRM
jgi:hypothetical protein